jgi:hypothetical protein
MIEIATAINGKYIACNNTLNATTNQNVSATPFIKSLRGGNVFLPMKQSQPTPNGHCESKAKQSHSI